MGHSDSGLRTPLPLPGLAAPAPWTALPVPCQCWWVGAGVGAWEGGVLGQILFIPSFFPLLSCPCPSFSPLHPSLPSPIPPASSFRGSYGVQPRRDEAVAGEEMGPDGPGDQAPRMGGLFLTSGPYEQPGWGLSPLGFLCGCVLALPPWLSSSPSLGSSHWGSGAAPGGHLHLPRP